MNDIEKKVNKTERTLCNKPDSKWFWRGLGGNFDNLTQILCEFIDNSLSNFIKYNQSEIKKIIIRIEEKADNSYSISVEDTGTGINDLNAAFSIGNREAQETSLNEHGFGMKHALAAANIANDNWLVQTRTNENAKENFYSEISCPYDYEGQKVFENHSGGWPGIQKTGTIVKFYIDNHLFKTITKGIRGGLQNLIPIVDVLAEDLGYIYADFIKNNIASITIRYKKLGEPDFQTKDISSVEPNFESIIAPGKGETKLDLGFGEVLLRYEFLEAKESNYRRHYNANMATSGVEIRINGRLLADNLFTEIWGQEKHNAFNYLLIRINIESDDHTKLPSTTTSKNGLRQDDERLEKVYEWIRSKLPEPKRKASSTDHEIELFKVLEGKKLKTLKDYDKSLVVKREMNAFTTFNEKIRIDLYVSCLNETTIYEGKKDMTTPLDVYQLMMYWDGLVMDNVQVDKGILISAKHPESVKVLVENKNQLKDSKGKQYNFVLKTWKEEDIDYPN